jgi:hypothetical protein
MNDTEATRTVTLVDFLLARITEDEAAVTEPNWWTHGETPWKIEDLGELTTILAVDPRRVLAECEAKRRIVDMHGPDHDCQMPSRYNQVLRHAGNGFRPCPTLRALAIPYAGHPDCREEWVA